MLLRQHPKLLLLSLAQALYWSCSIIGIALTGLVGQRLSPWPLLTTLPLTLLVVGNLVAIGQLARWMQRLGRARGLQCGALFGIGWGLAGYCPGPALVGVTAGVGSAVVFTLAMLAGMLLFGLWQRRRG